MVNRTTDRYTIRYYWGMATANSYKGYANRDGPAGSLVTVVTSNGETPLPHLMQHSPDGFAWGYSGSGPSDLARSIIGHATNNPNPEPALYQKFKGQLVAHMPKDDDWVLPRSIVDQWLAENT